jgi:hypothetical protein
MNFLIISLASAFVGGVSFYFAGDAGLVAPNAAVLLSFEAVIAAGILVRLNRGVPSLDWKAVEKDAVEGLLARLEQTAKVYIAIIGLTLLSIIVLLGIVYVNALTSDSKYQLLMVLSTIFGILLGLVIGRMAYVVWLDLDIVRLQAVVIRSAVNAEDVKKQGETATEKLAAIGAARLPQK